MIPYDFSYLRPATFQEAVEAFQEFSSAGKQAIYYGGGSEILSMSRVGAIQPDAVVDIKNIPEMNVISVDRDGLTLGAALTLNQVKESRLFPLMSLACGRIADHTNQCRITLGGNLCGTIQYRETSLPLLISDAEVVLWGPEGEKSLPFQRAFDGRIRRAPNEILAQVRIPSWALEARCAHIKKTAREKIDYPLINVTALMKDGMLRCAFSGIAGAPFRSVQVEAILNHHGTSSKVRAAQAVAVMSAFARGDVEVSKEYRLFETQNTLRALLEDWENGSI